MQDVVGGVERIRKWPEKRGKPKSAKVREQNDWFRQAQWATKYMDPSFLQDAERATRGSPLLPRDILTMIFANRLCAFQLKDGRRLVPTTMVMDVSKALDVFEPSEGQVLQRGPEYWQAVDLPEPGGGAAWEVLLDQVITSATPSLVVTGLDEYAEVAFLCLGVTSSGNGWRQVELSVDGGATFYATPGDYVYVEGSGAVVNNAAAISHNTSSSSARTFFGTLVAPKVSGTPKMCRNETGAFSRVFTASSLPVNAARMRDTAGNMTGGRWVVIGMK